MSDLFATLMAALPPREVSEMSLAPDEILFRQGDRTEGLFRLVDGRVDLVRCTAAGAIARIHAARPGETFAEAALHADRYHCDAVAGARSTVVRFAKRAVLAAFEADPPLAAAFSIHLAQTLRETRRRLELLFVTPLTERLYLRLGELADAGGRLPPGVTIKSVAEEIGATPEATYRALAGLEQSGRLSRPSRGVVRLLQPKMAGRQTVAPARPSLVKRGRFPAGE